MNPYKRLAAVLLAVAAPVVGRAGPTLYDMQHSSVLRQRLPPHLRVADHHDTSSETKQPEEKKTKQERDDAATSAGPAGTSGTTTTEPGAGKK